MRQGCWGPQDGRVNLAEELVPALQAPRASSSDGLCSHEWQSSVQGCGI